MNSISSKVGFRPYETITLRLIRYVIISLGVLLEVFSTPNIMYCVKRGKAQGGFNVIRKKGGSIPRMMNMRSEGLGKAQTEDFYKKSDVSHPFKTLGKGNMKSMAEVKIKSTRPKKYISLNT